MGVQNLSKLVKICLRFGVKLKTAYCRYDTEGVVGSTVWLLLEI